MNFTNGSIWKAPNSKLYLLQYLTGAIFCIFEIAAGGLLNIVTDEQGKWQYSEEELPERLAGFIPEPVVPAPTFTPPKQTKKKK